jgi:hypothetical protein
LTNLSFRLRKLCLLGSVSSLLYLSLAVIFWTDAIFDKSGRVQTAIYIIIGALTLLYFTGIRMVRETSVRDILVCGAVFAVIGFAAGPFDSTDVFFYIAQGWNQTNYDANPYSDVLRDNPSGLKDPMIATRWMQLNRNPWLDEPIPYGFGFALLTRFIAWVGSGNWWLTLALFNLLNLAIHAAVGWLLWRTAALIPGTNPKLILYLYAWSPLIVLQYLANVHNDIIMASLIVLAFYLMLSGRVAWALPAIVAAGFVKYVAFALAPFALTYVYRRHGRKQAIKAVVMSIAVGVAVSFPYVWELQSFKLDAFLAQLTESTGSLHAFVTFSYRAISRLILSETPGLESFSSIAKIGLWSIVAAWALYQLSKSWRRKGGPREVATRWTSILFAVIFVGSSQFYAWYIGMLFPMALLGTGASRLTDIVVLLSGTHMALTFMRGRSIGYFLLATLIPVLFVIWNQKNRSESFLSSGRSEGENL